MSCVSIIDQESRNFCFACNTVDRAFGPLMYVPEGRDLEETVEAFRDFLEKDPRQFTDEELCTKWCKFYEEEGI